MKMKITVVTVCYNAVHVIESTIASVLHQTYPDVEYIVIDGGSNDGTCDIIDKYAALLSYYISEPDHGIYDAMNKGIVRSTGDFVIFMNAGDEFADSETLQKLVKYVEKDDADVWYGDVIYRYKYGKRLVKADRLTKIEHDMVFSHQSVFIKANLLKKNVYNIKYKLAADYDLLLRLYRLNSVFAYLGFPVSQIEVDEGATYANFLKSKKETLRIQIDNGMHPIMAYAIYCYKVPRLYVGKLAKKILPEFILSSHFKVEKL